VTFISIHSVIIYVVFFGTCMRCTRLCLLSPGCDRSGIRGMLTVGQNLDRNGQNHYLLSLLWFFYKLILIFSHLFLLYSDYSYLFFLKTNVDFTLWNPVPKGTFMTRRPSLSNKNKTILIGIYTLECLCLWYLFDLDLWLSVMSCGVMSTIKLHIHIGININK
jgi:hypothetical protein